MDNTDNTDNTPPPPNYYYVHFKHTGLIIAVTVVISTV